MAPEAAGAIDGWIRRGYRRLRQALDEQALRRQAWRAAGTPGQPELDDPIFVVGCPRSGTTLLGRLLGTHPEVLYLNEPHWLWSGLARVADAWNPRRAGRARLVLRAEDATGDLPGRARRALARLLTVSGRRRLVEKTPDNSARLDWLDAVFPRARVVHLLREPHAVATSLSRALADWFPHGGWKGSPQYSVWDRHCRLDPALAAVWETATSDYERGLVMWREQNRLAWESGRRLGPERYRQVRFEALVADPAGTLAAVLDGLDLPAQTGLLAAAQARVRRQDSPPGADPAVVARFVGREWLDAFGYPPAPEAR